MAAPETPITVINNNIEIINYFVEKGADINLRDGLGFTPIFYSIIAESGYLLKYYLEKEQLTDNEVKLGIALLELFENYKTIFLGTDNNKFNKNIILLSIREMTNLSTKEIRNAMKRFKKLYYVVLNGMIE